ncbi:MULTISPECIES: YbhB/YbcL family Raf kinase inhibitor-like protein [unclassified Clostridium]|uniref:YbhB/YbcL family Raf kinase inhibitor-like protein n=1 Tax=unclassified Clostridium TaxID=2614128 RepID=UPI00054F6CCB|nr:MULTISPECIES: YbhB/YbcL family Raf kinase inhibitor-like protein [unclassified Clostridium]
MKITSSAIVNGIIQDKYGKRGQEFKNKQGEMKQQFDEDACMPVRSIPIKIEEAPNNTVSYCIFIEDKDAIPVCGFSWIHWSVANLTRNVIEENESVVAKDFIQGVNSWYGAAGGFDREIAIGYGGMTPPDKPHKYHISVYALDTTLELQNGFFVNELFTAMEGHVIDVETVSATYFN